MFGASGPVLSRPSNDLLPTNAAQTVEKSQVKFVNYKTERVCGFTAENMPQPAHLGAQNLNAESGDFASQLMR